MALVLEGDTSSPLLAAAPTAKMRASAFDRLPDEIIEQILHLTSPNGFASLIVLNRKWRTVSQQAHLYAHHLSKCPSYSAAHRTPSFSLDEDNLPNLRSLFCHEVKRNLFEAYLRPKETIIKLVSTSISSSSAPGGEAFHFSISPKGHFVLAYSSSRIHVIKVTGQEAIVKRELKILRRPACAAITDDGFLLAVLSTDLQVDLYDLAGDLPKHTKIVSLDHSPRTIALAPNGAVMAAAYDSGVEVSSLDPECLNNERRAVKCYGVDSLSFSRDGTQLLGTTMQSRNPSTVVLTAPYYDPGGMEENVSALWTTSILFPNASRDCSHAVLLPSAADSEISWTFTYDRVFETFRAVRIDDLRNGTTYFTGPIADAQSAAKLLPSTLPTANDSGDLVAAGFQGSIWLYGVPEDLEALPTINNGLPTKGDSESDSPNQPSRENSGRSARPAIRSHEGDNSGRTPQWQILCDRYRNTIVEGRKIGSLDGVNAMKWVFDDYTSCGERLVAVAPGVSHQQMFMAEDESMEMEPVDGGRISILDFDYSVSDGERRVITVEVGLSEPETLEEEHRDMATEVAIVRRRTVAQRRGGNGPMNRAVTTITRPARQEAFEVPGTVPPVPTVQPVRRASEAPSTGSLGEGATVDDDPESFDDPYSQGAPRSVTTLRRAATAAAANRTQNPRVPSHGPIEYRRADGREEHPHESDADNWVPPPPPYSKEPVSNLPEHIQRILDAEHGLHNMQQANNPPPLPPLPDMNSLQSSQTIPTSVHGAARLHEPLRQMPHPPEVNHDRPYTASNVSVDEDREQARPSMPRERNEDLYNVSPQGSPQLTPTTDPSSVPVLRMNTDLHQIPRRPITSSASAISPALITQTSNPDSMPSPVSPARDLTRESVGRRLREWETAADPASASTESGSPESRRHSSYNHRLPTLPTAIRPFQGTASQDIESLSNSRRVATMPVSSGSSRGGDAAAVQLQRRSTTISMSTQPPISMSAQPSISISTQPPTSSFAQGSNAGMPSADQLARLNSRRERPPEHVLNRTSKVISYADPTPRAPSRGETPQYTQDSSYRAAPRAAVGARSVTPVRSNSGRSGTERDLPFRRRTLGPGMSRRGSSSPAMRPGIERLNTIQSVTSHGERTPQFSPMPMTIGRQPSRAERSAAKNIQDAKKKGWRGNKSSKKKDKKFNDAGSSAGWTDVSHDETHRKGESKGSKCAVM